MSDLLAKLAAAPGIYRGKGDGPESGPFHARLEVRSVVEGRAVTLDYEAFGEHGVRRVEHSMLSEDERSRPELYMVADELPGIVRFAESEPGVFAVFEPIKAKVAISLSGDGTLTYAWWWTRDDSPAKAQSRAELRRTS
ncbi:MAG: hypothetical protein ACRDXX_00300 [Stackebrandtia sp.]